MKNKNTINNKKEKNTMTYNLKNTKINFVSAEDGKVFLGYVENGVRKEKGSENPIILADIMTKLGFEDTVMGSSSMDFASEYGFKKDGDAKKLYQNAINLI
tara:strand:+ start:1241 stop:1543 length:303 start_codon:yes stop_codon:yes gene_type:complete